MNARIALCAVAALAAAPLAHAGTIDPPDETVDLGRFINTGLATIDYQGDFGDFVFASLDVNNSTRIDVDLGGVLAGLGDVTFFGIRVIDTGENQYGANSAGADIDLFTLTGMDDGTEITYLYDGPNQTHQGESSSILETRVAAIDAQSGVHEHQGLLNVSLANQGMLIMMLSTPQGGGGIQTGGTAGTGPMLHIREAGVGEAFRIELLTAPVPAPGSLALLGLAALTGRRRRRLR